MINNNALESARDHCKQNADAWEEEAKRQQRRAEDAEKALRDLGKMAQTLFADHFHNDAVTWDECIEPACDFADAVITAAEGVKECGSEKSQS